MFSGNPVRLTADEAQLLALYRRSSPASQDLINVFVQAAYERHPADPPPNVVPITAGNSLN